MNLALAMLAALAFHLLVYLPDAAAQWLAENLKNALIINVLLAIFNLLPLPPLDGGRIAVGVLPNALAMPARAARALWRDDRDRGALRSAAGPGGEPRS
jgi:Zn-dependent protease